MTWGPAQFVQQWSDKLPGEMTHATPLPSYQDNLEAEARRLESVLLRQGVAPTDQASAADPARAPVINIPIAPAQPLIQLTLQNPSVSQLVRSMHACQISRMNAGRAFTRGFPISLHSSTMRLRLRTTMMLFHRTRSISSWHGMAGTLAKPAPLPVRHRRAAQAQ